MQAKQILIVSYAQSELRNGALLRRLHRIFIIKLSTIYGKFFNNTYKMHKNIDKYESFRGNAIDLPTVFGNLTLDDAYNG